MAVRGTYCLALDIKRSGREVEGLEPYDYTTLQLDFRIMPVKARAL